MSERIRLTDDNIEEAAQKAAEVLRQGGVILYPTDTLYGLGADSLNKEALEKIYKIKGRDEGKPMHSIIADIDSAAPYALVTPLAHKLSDHFLPGPLTLIIPKTDATPAWAVAGTNTLGVRVPANAFCLFLADLFGQPFTATSANKSGEPTLGIPDKILEQLGSAAEDIDLIIDAGELGDSKASTVVDAREDKPIILREGAISTAEINASVEAS